MSSTVRDFVKMLYERECGVVVMLCGCEEEGCVQMCAQYYPTSVGTVVNFGEFLVCTEDITENNGVIRRAISITDSKVIMVDG